MATGKKSKNDEKKRPDPDRKMRSAARAKGAGAKNAVRSRGERIATVAIVSAVAILLLAIAYMLIREAVSGGNGAPGRVEDLPYRREVREAHVLEGVEEARIYAVIQTESSFRANAVSPSGARGLMQMLPSTYEEECLETGASFDPEALFDPSVNIPVCTRYLRKLHDIVGSWDWAHVAYYAGIGNALKWMEEGLSLGDLPNESAKIYLERINSAYDAYAVMFRAYEEKNAASGASGGTDLLSQRIHINQEREG